MPPSAPRGGKQSSEYMQWVHVRKRHRLGSLTLEEYAELAHQPHILGPEVFGEVVASGTGWSWSFKAAGLAVESPVVFQHRANAVKSLAAIQKTLYPDWHCASQRGQVLSRVMSEVAQLEEL